MTSFLKGLWRGSHSKHRKLLEDWTSVGKDAEAEVDTPGGSGSSEGDVVEVSVGASFSVKYLGSSLVDRPNGETATADAIKTVIAMSKVSGKKLQRVILSVSLRGIKVVDTATDETQLDISIYRISYCSADAAYNHVFAFIATNLNETNECHAFLCRKRKLAQSATLAIARTFNTAYELWQLSHDEASTDDAANDDPEPPKINIVLIKNDEADVTDYEGNIKDTVEEKKMISDNSHLLIDFTKEIDLPKKKENIWVSFEEDEADLPKKNPAILPPAENEERFIDWGEKNGSLDLLSLP